MRLQINDAINIRPKLKVRILYKSVSASTLELFVEFLSVSLANRFRILKFTSLGTICAAKDSSLGNKTLASVVQLSVESCRMLIFLSKKSHVFVVELYTWFSSQWQPLSFSVSFLRQTELSTRQSSSSSHAPPIVPVKNKTYACVGTENFCLFYLICIYSSPVSNRNFSYKHRSGFRNKPTKHFPLSTVPKLNIFLRSFLKHQNVNLCSFKTVVLTWF